MVDDVNVSSDLGLVTAVLDMSSDVLEAEGRQTHTIKVRIETADGGHYSISLTIEAAKAMISGIATWPPITHFLLERNGAKLQ